jgi:PAS domain S-box-containing protein
MNEHAYIQELQRQLAHERAERQHAEAALRHRIAFEALVTRISARFLNLPAAEIDAGIDAALAEIGTLAAVDRSYVFRVSDDQTTMTNTHEWCAPQVPPVMAHMQTIQVARLPWFGQQVLRGEVVHVARVADLPPEAAAIARLCHQQRSLSFLVVPLKAQGHVIGFLGFDSVQSEKSWSHDSIALLQVVGEIIATTWQRQRAETALHESQRMLSELMHNLPGMAYRCHVDAGWTMEFVSEGSLALTGYAPVDLIGNRRIAYGSLIHPDDRERVQQTVQAALEAQQPFEVTYRLTTASGAEKWVWEQGRRVEQLSGTVEAIEGFITDMSQRVQAQQQLEQRVSERTRQLTTLLDISQHVTSTLEMQPLLGVILDQVREVVAYTAASIFVLDGDELCILAYRGPGADLSDFCLPLAEAGANREVIQRRVPLIIDDVRSDTPLAREFQATAGDALLTTFGYMRSWMGVPLMIKERVVGMLTLDHSAIGAYTADQARVALAFAQQAGIAIENARLYDEARRRAEETEALLTVQQVLSSRLDPDAVMQMIAEEARRLIGVSFGALFVREDETLCVTALAGSYGPGMFVGYKMPLHESATGLALLSGEVVRIDSLDDPRIYRAGMEAAHIQSMIGIPLHSGDTPIGVISVGAPQPHAFTTDDEAVLALLAPGAAIALENARLYAQAQQAAALEERQRLARDLHDAVTQTLFSASMIADVLPRLWERKPEEGQRRLAELRQLTRGALAEMRTLLLELRPAALRDANLGDVLHQLGEAATGRARLPATVTVTGEAQLPPDVRVTFYRIAQEAVQNVIKHAHASQVELTLHREPDGATLRICDDGRGFDPASVDGGHFGLRIMDERAATVGAALQVESQPGQGTIITVTWKQSTDEGV